MRRPGGAVVAIVGAGASGTITAAHLLRRGDGVARVVLIDRVDHGPGVAYSTEDPQHLLNVRASGMSAFDDEPGELLRWCRERGVDAGPDTFLPRRLYGEYLRSLLVRFGDPERLELVRATATNVTSAGRTLTIATEGGATVTADAAVLALGNPPPSLAPVEVALGRCVVDPWLPGALDELDHAGRIAVIGTGMTAVDVILSMTARNPQASVWAISRHGRLPEAHLAGTPASGAARVDARHSRHRPPATDLTTAMHEALAAADWREAIDSLRPETQRLWQAMTLVERRSFLAQHKSRWDTHRHRSAPQVAARIDELRREGRLQIVAGAIQAAGVDPDGVTLRIRQGQASIHERADMIVNATGPSPRIADVDNPLVRSLLAGGRAVPDALGIGFATGPDGGLLDHAGEVSDQLFTIGPPRRGELFESTAVPEIRTQAAQISHRLAGGAQSCEKPMSSTRLVAYGRHGSLVPRLLHPAQR